MSDQPKRAKLPEALRDDPLPPSDIAMAEMYHAWMTEKAEANAVVRGLYFPLDPLPPQPRVTTANGVVFVDGVKYDKLTANQLKLVELLLDARGDYVAMSDHKLKSRDVLGLPEEICQLIDSQPGAGTRFIPEVFGMA